MKVIPERETVWAWLAKSLTALGKAFELPAFFHDSGGDPQSPRPKQSHPKDLLHTDEDSKHSSSSSTLPDLQMIDDASSLN